MEKIKFAITPGFEVGGTIFRPEQLAVLGSIVGTDAKIEMTTFKQLYVEVSGERAEEIQKQLQATGLDIYPVGSFTKSLITCNFCKGAEDAGLAIAKILDAAITGLQVPSPLKVGFSGCALATGEPLLKDIGVVKMLNTYDIYVGGESKGLKAKLGELFISELSEEQLVTAVLRLIELFGIHAKKKEKFSKFIERMTIDSLRSHFI